MKHILTVLFLLVFTNTVHCREPMRVAFINPDKAGNPFWDQVESFMLDVAGDLDIEVDRFYANQSRFEAIDIVKRLSEQAVQPDYLIFIYQAGSGAAILDLAEKAGIGSFVINTDIYEADKERVGLPRQRYQHWLGHMYPDDFDAGKQLADYLINLSLARSGAHDDEAIAVVGFGGSKESMPGIERNRGLEAAVAAQKAAVLKQAVFTQWDAQRVAHQLEVLATRYPKIDVIWAASDALAMAAAKTAKVLWPQARDFVVGGIDWTREGLKAVQVGQIDVSVGGHFMEAGWAMILLHDYHHGRDFKDHGLSIKSKMSVLDQQALEALMGNELAMNFEHVDFCLFSRVCNPDLDRYQLRADVFLAAESASQLQKPVSTP